MASQSYPWMKYPVRDINRDMNGLPDVAEACYHRLARTLWELGPLPEEELAARGGDGWARIRHLFKYRSDTGDVSLLWVEEAREGTKKRSESAKKAGSARAASAKHPLSARSASAPAHAQADAEHTLSRIENRDKRKREKRDRGPKELFDHFEITAEEAEGANTSLSGQNIDFAAYVTAISIWSATKGEKRDREGWLATFRQFVERDRVAGSLKTMKALTPKLRVPVGLTPPPL